MPERKEETLTAVEFLEATAGSQEYRARLVAELQAAAAAVHEELRHDKNPDYGYLAHCSILARDEPVTFRRSEAA